MALHTKLKIVQNNGDTKEVSGQLITITVKDTPVHFVLTPGDDVYRFNLIIYTYGLSIDGFGAGYSEDGLTALSEGRKPDNWPTYAAEGLQRLLDKLGPDVFLLSFHHGYAEDGEEVPVLNPDEPVTFEAPEAGADAYEEFSKAWDYEHNGNSGDDPKPADDGFVIVNSVEELLKALDALGPDPVDFGGAGVVVGTTEIDLSGDEEAA